VIQCLTGVLPRRMIASMDTTKLSSKGQIILPKRIRTAHRWEAGTEFAVEAVADGVLLRPLRTLPATTLDQAVGSSGYTGPARTDRQLSAAIKRGVKDRRGRGRY
jgi:AbrB family looped-hinge helix DNA binding protein